MKNILVTGARGQLALSIKERSVLYPNCKFIFKSSTELDITNLELINATMSKANFDFCINCAAFTDVEQAEKTPQIAFEINAMGARNLAYASREYDFFLIHISTDYVFDGKKKTPYTIYDRTNPINEYGKSKLLGEEFIREILNNYCIIRTSWLYSEYGENFYKTVLEKARNNEIISITDQQIGCPTNASSLAKFILDGIQDNALIKKLYHFNDGVAMTWYEFAKKIISDNGLERTVQVVRNKNYRTFAKRPKNSVLI